MVKFNSMRVLMIILLMIFSLTFSKELGFTQEDRERLIRLETKLEVFMEQTNRRFSELREDMNKRFEQIGNELNRLVQIMIGIFAGQFGLIAAVIAFAWWDRRTIIREAKRQTIEELERETKPEKLRKLLNALREKAKTDKELEEILKREGLL